MKKTLILLTIISLLFSCSIKEKPEFLRVENIKVIESSSDFVTLSADAFFNNPNDIGGQLMSEGIKVIIDGTEMATVTSEAFKVPANKEFSIPLKANIASKKLLNLNNLSGILNSLLNKKLKVQYVGEIKYKVLGFSHTYKVDKTEDIKVKL